VFDLADAIQMEGSLGPRLEMRVEIRGMAGRARAKHQPNFIERKRGRIGVDTSSGGGGNEQVAKHGSKEDEKNDRCRDLPSVFD